MSHVLRRISSPHTKLLAARCECLHLIKMNCLALRLDESAHASLAASCEELRARTGNPPLGELLFLDFLRFGLGKGLGLGLGLGFGLGLE